MVAWWTKEGRAHDRARRAGWRRGAKAWHSNRAGSLHPAGSSGDGEHLALHHTKAQAQGQRGKERGGTTAGTEVPRIQLYGWSGHQAHDRAEISGTVQTANPGHHAQGQGRQHEDDNGRVGPVYAGLAQLFWLLRNARGVGGSHSLGPVAIAGRSVASVENTTSPPCGTDRIAKSLGSCAIRPTAAVAHGASPGAKPSPSGFPMPTSNRSVSPP